VRHTNYCRCGKTWRVADSSIPVRCPVCRLSAWFSVETRFHVEARIPPKFGKETLSVFLLYLRYLKNRRGKNSCPKEKQPSFLPPLALTCVDRAMARRKQQMATVRAARAGLELRWLTPREKLKAMPPPRCIVMWDGVDAPKASVTGSPNWRQKGSGQGIDREDSPMWHNVVRAIEDG